MKPDAPELLRKELADPKYSPRMIAMGTNTDPYQPIEKKWRVTRGILEVLRDAGHPVGIVTKSALVMRDIDILKDMAKKNLAKVALSITTLDPKLARVMEPRAATPAKRLEAVRALSEAGIPAAVMVAPIVPAINDAEIERILDAAKAAGAESAGYVMPADALRDQGSVREWLREHFSGEGKARDFARTLAARRQGLRRRMGQAPDRRRAPMLGRSEGGSSLPASGSG